MRQYIRHPTRIPIEYTEPATVVANRDYLEDISEGGLCFHCEHYLEPAKHIEIAICVGDEPFRSRARVRWCRSCGDRWEVGVQFETEEDRFGVRMVEQVCHIEEYRQQILSEQGRELSSEQAAAEWVEKYAAQFPSM